MDFLKKKTRKRLLNRLFFVSLHHQNLLLT